MPDGYWERRREYRYYREVVEAARRHVPDGGAVLDVGARGTEVLERLDWFERRVAIDLLPAPPSPGIETVAGDFLSYDPGAGFDLVLCLQVLEHLESPAPIARKALAAGRTAIVSVPYLWPGWTTEEHVQDPVDARMLASWSGAELLEAAVVEDLGMERLIAVYGDPMSTRSTSPSGIWRKRVPSSRNEAASPVHRKR